MIYKITNNSSVDIAQDLLSKGEMIICPTDTLYGFSVDATNSIAIEKLNILKNRISPYSIILDRIDEITKYASSSSSTLDKIKNILPGPYTVILNKKKGANLSKLVTLDLDTIGIRIPNHLFSCKLVEKFKRPIITTSVNLHGSDSLNTIDKIYEAFNKITIFEDSKSNNNSSGSTIIDFTYNPEKILRVGDGHIN